MPNSKRLCTVCRWRGHSSELLTVDAHGNRAVNPFDPEDKVNGCPVCRSIDCCIAGVCDIDDCWEPATCGTPTPTGYTTTCGKHEPDQ